MGAVFSLVSCVAAVHGIRAAMRSLKKTGTDFTSAQGMDPKAFFEVMGTQLFNNSSKHLIITCLPQVFVMWLSWMLEQEERHSSLFKTFPAFLSPLKGLPRSHQSASHSIAPP